MIRTILILNLDVSLRVFGSFTSMYLFIDSLIRSLIRLEHFPVVRGSITINSLT